LEYVKLAPTHPYKKEEGGMNCLSPLDLAGIVI
jgi:hypothetical protein